MPSGLGPSYSGRLIARAVELYLNGIKPGYLRWHELQEILEKEFPGEIKQKGADRPTPETVMRWVRKYPDAPERLRQLRAQEANPASEQAGISLQSAPLTCWYGHPGSSHARLSLIFTQFMALVVLVLMIRLARDLLRA
ncbi:MAG: hypothetical protein N2506_03350 [Dehalococcoidales bacterium]|nr:hypothetical protein [Dehalococcoidales bacterium]